MPRNRLAAALLLGTLGGAVACRHTPSKATSTCKQDAASSVVACVDDTVIRKDEVSAFVREPTWTPGVAALPDPRRAALDEAIRLHLFAQEARARKLAPASGAPAGSPQGIAQALMQSELAARGLGRDSVSDDEAKRWFDDHPEAFGEIDDVHVQAIVLRDPRLAEQVWAKAKGADRDAFAALATAYSIDEPSKAKGADFGWIHAGRDADRTLLGLVLGLRRPGSIGGPVRAADGRWYVLRILEAPLEHQTPWGELAKAKAKNLLARERQRVALDALEASLRSRATIVVFDDALATVSSKGQAATK